MIDLRYGNLSENGRELGAVAEPVFRDQRDNPRAGADLGFFGVGTALDSGGADGDSGDVAVLIECAGAERAASSIGDVTMVCAPLLAKVVDMADRRWQALLAGELLPALPVSSPWAASDAVTVEDRTLSASLILLGGDPVGLLALPCKIEGAESIVFLEAGADGLGVERVRGTDTARPTWRLSAQGVNVESAWMILSRDGLFAEWMARRAAAAALDAIGAARSALGITLEYARVREQFGQPIGSFQAYQHRCADAFSRLTLGQSLAFNSASAANAFELLPALAAGRLATANASFVCGEAVQLHGAIGFTWEAGLHHYLKRARLDEIIGRGCVNARDLLLQLDRESDERGATAFELSRVNS